MLQTVLKYIAGPLIGAVIGYCTNYLAVKMLFRPKQEHYLFGHKLPFTPGAIPKERPRIAKAVGEIVSNTLLTGDDIADSLCTKAMEDEAVGKIMSLADRRISDIGTVFDDYDMVKDHVCERLADEITSSACSLGIGEMVSQKGAEYVLNMTRGTMLEMFLGEQTVVPMTAAIGQEIEKYIYENGKSFVLPIIRERASDLENSTPSELLAKEGIDREDAAETVRKLYREAASRAVAPVLSSMNIAGMIEDKINAMNVDELEKLVLSVMKKELDTIVDLGALIGFVIGLLMLLV